MGQGVQSTWVGREGFLGLGVSALAVSAGEGQRGVDGHDEFCSVNFDGVRDEQRRVEGEVTDMKALHLLFKRDVLGGWWHDRDGPGKDGSLAFG